MANMKMARGFDPKDYFGATLIEGETFIWVGETKYSVSYTQSYVWQTTETYDDDGKSHYAMAEDQFVWAEI